MKENKEERENEEEDEMRNKKRGNTRRTIFQRE